MVVAPTEVLGFDTEAMCRGQKEIVCCGYESREGIRLSVELIWLRTSLKILFRAPRHMSLCITRVTEPQS